MAGEWLMGRGEGDVYSEDYHGRYDGEFTYRKLLSRNLSHQAAFYKRSLFDRLGNYDLRYKLHADWEFNLRALAVGDFGEYDDSHRHECS